MYGRSNRTGTSSGFDGPSGTLPGTRREPPRGNVRGSWQYEGRCGRTRAPVAQRRPDRPAGPPGSDLLRPKAQPIWHLPFPRHRALVPVWMDEAAAKTSPRNELELRHFLNGVARTFTARTGEFDAAIRHLVYPIGRYLVDMKATDVNFPRGAEGFIDVARVHAGLEPVVGSVDQSDRFVECFVGVDADYGSEGFLRAQIRVRRNVG